MHREASTNREDLPFSTGGGDVLDLPPENIGNYDERRGEHQLKSSGSTLVYTAVFQAGSQSNLLTDTLHIYK